MPTDTLILSDGSPCHSALGSHSTTSNCLESVLRRFQFVNVDGVMGKDKAAPRHVSHGGDKIPALLACRSRFPMLAAKSGARDVRRKPNQ